MHTFGPGLYALRQALSRGSLRALFRTPKAVLRHGLPMEDSSYPVMNGNLAT